MHWCTLPFILISLPRISLSDPSRTDDSDSAVNYTGAWTHGQGIPDDASQNWDGTLHYSNISGAKATFKFTGTSVAVYGSFHPPGRYSMQSKYSVDGMEPFVFLPNQDVSNAIHQTLFYSSPQLPHGEHTLVVTNLGQQLFLDFFDVSDENNAPSPSSTTPPTSTFSSNTPSHVTTPSSSFRGGQTETVTSTTIEQLGTTTVSASADLEQTTDQQHPAVAGSMTTDATLSLSTIDPPAAPPTQPSTGTTVPSPPTTGNSSVTPLGAAQSPIRDRSRRLSEGEIAGIAVGGVVMIAVLGAGFWWYRRSRQLTWLATDLLRVSRAVEVYCTESKLPRTPPNVAGIYLRRPPCFRAAAERAVVFRSSRWVQFIHTVHILRLMGCRSCGHVRRQGLGGSSRRQERSSRGAWLQL